MTQSLGRPVETLQTQSQRVACTHVIRGHGHRAFEQIQRLIVLAFLFEARRDDIEQHGMLKSAGKRLLGQG
jgi:hypothetical protein